VTLHAQGRPLRALADAVRAKRGGQDQPRGRGGRPEGGERLTIVVRIAISEAAFEAIVKTLPVGSGGFENKVNEKAERLIWLEPQRPEPVDHVRLRTPAERRVHRRFVSAQRLVAGHNAFGQGVLVEVGAQARHSVGEVAHVYADERALFCPGQLFLTALHGFAERPDVVAFARMLARKKLGPFWRPKVWNASALSSMPRRGVAAFHICTSE
jgi:hypothetical protein